MTNMLVTFSLLLQKQTIVESRFRIEDDSWTPPRFINEDVATLEKVFEYHEYIREYGILPDPGMKIMIHSEEYRVKSSTLRPEHIDIELVPVAKVYVDEFTVEKYLSRGWRYG